MDPLMHYIVLAAAVLAVGAVACVAMYLHQKGMTPQQFVDAAKLAPRTLVQDVLTVDRAYMEKEFGIAKNAISVLAGRLEVKPFPGVGAAFVDLFDVGEQYGLSGTKQGVILDGKPVRTGIDPPVILKTVEGLGIVRSM